MATLNLPLRPAAAAALPPMPVNQARGNYPASLTTYTYVCGYVRPAVGVPTKKLQVKPTNPSYHCPQCDSEFSRPFSVKQHFPRCVRRWGNPLGLSWDDHQSCTGWCRGEEDWRLTLDWTRRETDDQQKDMQAMAAAQQQVSSQTPQVDLTQPGATSVKQEGDQDLKMESIETDQIIKQEPDTDDNRDEQPDVDVDTYEDELETDYTALKKEPTDDDEMVTSQNDDLGDTPMTDDDATPRARSPNSEPIWLRHHQPSDPNASPTPFCYTPVPAPIPASYGQSQRNESEESDGLSAYMDRRTHYSETPALYNANNEGSYSVYGQGGEGEEEVNGRPGGHEGDPLEID